MPILARRCVNDEDADVAHILAYGAKFPVAAAMLLSVS